MDNFEVVFDDSFEESPPMSISDSTPGEALTEPVRPAKHTGQYGRFRSVQEIDPKYRHVFSYPYFNLIQSTVIDDALYSDKSIVVCAPTGSGKTVVFEMAIVQLLMQLEDKRYHGDFKIIYMAPVKALCTERLTEWYPKFTPLGHLCIEVTGDTDVDFDQLKPYKIIITTPEKWDMITRRRRESGDLADLIRLFLIDEVHILHDEARGPVLEAVVSRMKTVEESMQAAYRIQKAQLKHQSEVGDQHREDQMTEAPGIRFVAVSATVSNPEDVATWLGTTERPAVFYKMGEECRPVKVRRVVEGYHCAAGTSMFKFDLILSYKLWPIIEKYYDGKPTLIFCSTRKSVSMTAEILAKEVTVQFSPEQQGKLMELAAHISNKKLQALVLSGVGCHHAGLLFDERTCIERAFKERDLPILVTTTTLAMGVNLPAHLVIIKSTQQYVNGQYQEYSVSTVLQMVGRAGRPQFDTEATAVIMTRMQDKARYTSLVDGSGPLESSLHGRLAEHLNSEVALGTVTELAQGVQWARSTFLHVRAARDPRRYLGLALPVPAPQLIEQKMQEMCLKAMNGLARAGLIKMEEDSSVSSTPAGTLMSVYCLDLETMKLIMKVSGKESLPDLLWLVCQSHELAGIQLRIDERRTLNLLNRNTACPDKTIRYPMKGKITTKQMKFYCVMQAIFGCLQIPDPSLNQEATKLLRTADRICKGILAYVTGNDFLNQHPDFFQTVLSSILLVKCCATQLWPDSPYTSRQLRGIGPALSGALAAAGKTTFMLIEESHPRDLERIMNKHAPAGNDLRKQVSLLPKYQLSLEQAEPAALSVTVTLLNASYLKEHTDELTAGSHHKCYVIVGDSDNRVLLCTSFKDIHLIMSEDSQVNFWVKIRQDVTCTVYVHCISANYAGLDIFAERNIAGAKNSIPELKPLSNCDENCTSTNGTNVNTQKKVKQSLITETFKERKKRKNVNESTEETPKKSMKTCKYVSDLKEKFRVNNANSFTSTYDNRQNKLYDTITSLVCDTFSRQDDDEIPNTPENESLQYKSLQRSVLSNDYLVEDIVDMNEINTTNNLRDLNVNIDDILQNIESEITLDNRNNTIKKSTHRKNVNIQCGIDRNSPHNVDINRKSNLSYYFKPSTSDIKLDPDNKFEDHNFNIDPNDDISDENQEGFFKSIATNLSMYLQNATTKIKEPKDFFTNLPEEEILPYKYTNMTSSQKYVEKYTKSPKSVTKTFGETNYDIPTSLTTTAPTMPQTVAIDISSNNVSNILETNKAAGSSHKCIEKYTKSPKSVTKTYDETNNDSQASLTTTAPTIPQTVAIDIPSNSVSNILEINIAAGITNSYPGVIISPIKDIANKHDLTMRNFQTKTEQNFISNHYNAHANPEEMQRVNEHNKCVENNMPNENLIIATSDLLPLTNETEPVEQRKQRAQTDISSYQNFIPVLTKNNNDENMLVLPYKKKYINRYIPLNNNVDMLDLPSTKENITSNVKTLELIRNDAQKEQRKTLNNIGREENNTLFDEEMWKKISRRHIHSKLLPVMALGETVTRNSCQSNPDPFNTSIIEITESMTVQIQSKMKISRSGINIENTKTVKVEKRANFQKYDKEEKIGESNNCNVNKVKEVNETVENSPKENCKNLSLTQAHRTNRNDKNVTEENIQHKTNLTPVVVTVREGQINTGRHKCSHKINRQQCVVQNVNAEESKTKSEGDKDVKSILKEFYSVLRQPTNRDVIPEPELPKNPPQQEKKEKRKMFKIQDIDTINADLSNFVERDDFSNVSETLSYLNSYNETNENTRSISPEENYSNIDTLLNSKEHVDLVRSFSDTIPVLDENMFNPKQVLASCVENNDIIPPPPGFRDNEEYERVISPTKNQDTWILTNEDEHENMDVNKPYIPSYGVNVQHSNNNTFNTFKYNNTNNLLGKFKHVNKPKMSPRHKQRLPLYPRNNQF